MCGSKPKSPPPPPPPPQAAKAPDNIDKARRNKATGRSGFAVPGSTLLTGPSGAGAATTGKSTLLGG